MEPIIKAKNLDFIYNKGKDNEFHALVDINLEVYPDEFLVILGPSGCGKSTLLNVIAGLEVPDSGSIFVFGRDLIKMTKNDFAMYHRSDVGMIYQQYNLITSLSVMDNVALPQIFINVRKRKREKKAAQLLERFGILKHARKIPTELSGGQQQRIGIARSIINDPKIVLADEPVGNLDSVSAKNVLDILENLNEKEKRTIILVTHNPENTEYADRVIYMKDGVIVKEETNPKKHRKKDKKEAGEQEGAEMVKTKTLSDELKSLMRAYRGLSPDQINILIMPYKAKVFAHHFITTRTMEESKLFEEVIQRRLLGTISQEEFFDILDRPYREGGVGFDRRTAEKIVKRVNRVIRIAFFVYQKNHQRRNLDGSHDKITIEEKTERVADHLLKTCYYDHYHNLDGAQINRIQEAVRARLAGDIQKSEFKKFLDQPFKEGGVGLNVKTAKAITEEIELILILGFGMVPPQMGGSNTSAPARPLGETADNQEPQKGADMENESMPSDSDKETAESGQSLAAQPEAGRESGQDGQKPRPEEISGTGESEPAGSIIDSDSSKGDDKEDDGGSFVRLPGNAAEPGRETPKEIMDIDKTD
jgi:putative ABC transport system ATP-binding protein